jgi:hypothetical protein
MRSKLVFAFIAGVAIGVTLIARGCSDRKDSVAATNVETADRAAAGEGSRPMEFDLSANDDEGFDLPEREEIRQKRKLIPGTNVFVVGVEHFGADTDHTQVFVIGINGKVKVETADTDMAEVLIVRSAHKREDLQRQKVEIRSEYNQENLHIHVGDYDVGDDDWRGSRRTIRRRILKEIHGRDGANGSDDPLPEIRQRVILRLPRKTGVEIRDVGGDVTVGEISGHLTISGVTGNVRAIRVAGPVVVGGNVNGPVDITFAPLTGAGIKIYGDINGDVDLRFEGEVNADLNTWDVNGVINADLQNVETREQGWGRLKARKRIGKGGTLIEIHDVNGNVTLSKAAIREASVSKATAESEQRHTK